jgi:O-succinylbenzoate synthase
VPDRGMLAPGRVAVDPGLLDRWAVPPQRVGWWVDRVTACHALLREDAR